MGAGTRGQSGDVPRALPGSVAIDELAPGVVLYKMSGYLDGGFVPRFEEAAAAQVARGHHVDLFFDTDRMTGYHPEFRRRMTAWHIALKPQTRSLNVLVKSKLIAMAISVVNLFTGGMLKSFSTHAAFDAAMRAAIERARAE